MADIQIIIGYETVTQADQAFKILDKTVNSTARQYEQAFNRITSWQKKFSNEQNKVNASLNTQHLAQQKSNKSARDSAKAFEDAARAVEKEAAALRSLRMATDSVYRNQQKRLQMKKLLKSAIVAKTMTTEQAIVALKRYNAAQMSSTKVMGAAKNKMNGNNMAIQQLGYQFGDFAVQVQGGTSAFVAFSQQGAQLAGILPMVAGPLGLSMGAAVGLSAALGILIPIGSAVGRMFFEMRDSAKAAAKEAETLDGKLKSLSSTLEDYANSLDAIRSGVSLDELFATRGIESAVEELAKAESALKGIQQTAATTAGLSVFVDSLKKVFDKDTASKYKVALEAVIVAETRLARLRDKESAERFKNFSESRSSLLNELELLRAIEQYGEGSAQSNQVELDQELRLRLASIDAQVTSGELTVAQGVSLKKQVNAAAALGVQTRANAQEQERLDSAAADAYEKEERRQSRNASVVTQLHRVRQSQQREAREEQTRINALEAEVSEYAKNNNWEKTQLHKTTQQILAEAIEVHKQEKAIRKEIGDAAVEALKLAGVDITSGVDAAAKAAAVLAANLGVSLLAAQNIIGLQSTKTYGGRSPTGAEYNGQEDYTSELGYKNVDQLIEELTSKGKGGSGKSPQEQLAEYLKGKEQELELETKLVGIFGSERTVKSELFDIEQKYGKLIDTTQDSQLAGTLRQIEAEKERTAVLEEAKQQQEDLADSIANSMGDALMNIVDGTMTVKDAFRSMARDIIKQLYEVIVVQRIVGSAKAGSESGLAGWLINALPFADGGVISGGSQIQAYANGGVVGGPTTFPMAGGKTGLMGEAGPEAIMPLKRGSNGKLGVQMEGGGGQNVVVNQSFNFQANGDDTVKKLIAQAAPKIAQMTKSSLLDDRRRGGSTKAAFG